MGIKIIKPGLLSTIQDGGRFGYRKQGVIVSGAMDTVAYRLANILVGNNESVAAMEITLTGTEIFFEEDHLIAITGTELLPQINGQEIKNWRPVIVKKGGLLRFGKAVRGCRAYLSVAGGFDIPKSMGSCSTYLRAAIGGWKGRALQAGDNIPVKSLENKEVFNTKIAGNCPPDGSLFYQASWTPSPLLLPAYTQTPTIRIIPGPEWNWFSETSQEALFKQTFTITPQADRMGVSLKGPELLLRQQQELLSTAVTFGTIQVPSNGAPIVLMADHPTTGGYPRIAQVIKADLPLLAQIPPGGIIKFKKVSLQEAYQAFFQQEQYIGLIKKALNIKTGSGKYGGLCSRP